MTDSSACRPNHRDRRAHPRRVSNVRVSSDIRQSLIVAASGRSPLGPAPPQVGRSDAGVECNFGHRDARVLATPAGVPSISCVYSLRQPKLIAIRETTAGGSCAWPATRSGASPAANGSLPGQPPGQTPCRRPRQAPGRASFGRAMPPRFPFARDPCPARRSTANSPGCSSTVPAARSRAIPSWRPWTPPAPTTSSTTRV